MDRLPARWMPQAERVTCCVYCGVPIRHGLTCRAHSDLPELDRPRGTIRGTRSGEAA